MEQLIIYTAREFTEFFLNRDEVLVPINFYFPLDNKGELIDKYINAIDLMVVLGYRHYVKAWEKVKQDYSIDVEFSHIITEDSASSLSFARVQAEESKDGYKIIYQEDFLTLNQVVMILDRTNRIGLKEKRRLLNFIQDSI